MQITPIPCLTDNYAYVINDENLKVIGVVDPSEAQPIIKFLKKQNLKLHYILNTHHHFDHIGGNLELKKIYDSKIVGFNGDKHRIPGIDITLNDNEKWTFGNSVVLGPSVLFSTSRCYCPRTRFPQTLFYKYEERTVAWNRCVSTRQ